MGKDSCEKIAISLLCICGIMLIILLLMFSFLSSKEIEKRELKKELEFYTEESIREEPIISFNDTVVYVFDTFKDCVIEIDIFPELIHTTIETGDIAIYVVNYEYTDADLLGIIKKEDY